MTIQEIEVHSIMMDAGDGGGTTHLYFSNEDFLKTVNEKHKTNFTKVVEAVDFLYEDEYERGFYDSKTVKFEIVDGKFKSKGDWSFSWG